MCNVPAPPPDTTGSMDSLCQVGCCCSTFAILTYRHLQVALRAISLLCSAVSDGDLGVIATVCNCICGKLAPATSLARAITCSVPADRARPTQGVPSEHNLAITSSASASNAKLASEADNILVCCAADKEQTPRSQLSRPILP